MNALKALGLLLFCCDSLQGQILDNARGNIATTNIDFRLSSSKVMAIVENLILQLNEIRADRANEYHRI